jgi:MSHA biogenesis protein MshM
MFQGSGGVPRLINILAHKSLMAAFGEGEVRISREHARRAVEDTDDARTIAQAGLRTRLGQLWQRASGWFG